MKRILSTILFTSFFIVILLTIILSVFGLETNSFNTLISKKINQTNNNISLQLNTVKFKFDIKKISLFLETYEPKIIYRGTAIPAKNIKVYVDFISLLKSNPKISKFDISLKEIDINQLKNLSTTIKPSNFKSLINNKIKQGKLISELEIYLNEDNQLENFIARGSVLNLKANIYKDLNLKQTSFSFFADKADILIQNIFGELDTIKILDGDLKFKLSPEISLESNFNTNIIYNNKSLIDYPNLMRDFKYANNITNLKANLNNSLSISFDKTYKVKNFNYKNNGKVLIADLDFKKPIPTYFLNNNISQLSLKESQIKMNFNSEKTSASISGKYSIDDNDFLNFDLENFNTKDLSNLKLNFDYKKDINLDIINYMKPKNSIATLSIDFDKNKNNIKIKELKLIEKNNSISIEDLKIDKNKFLSFKKILVKTEKNGLTNNDFVILFGKKLLLKGSQFDATNLPKLLNKKEKKNILSNINKNVQIDFANITAPLSENIMNFRLIGEIKKGKFIKISSKGDFGNNNFIDISMKNDNKNKKYLEIYSDLTHPLLTEYSFFKGLTGGKLLFSSIIDGDNSNSKLKIENFKVINAPVMIKLLSLADLGGLADLAEGEGLSFDFLEISMNKSNDVLKLDEILALGPSISVLMEGYQDQSGLTSLRGTLIPAKTLNKMISKIPVLGNIIIPKEVGEGLFGISFKIKGTKGNIKTTINPIKTLTPRFIQKIIERDKVSK